MSRPALHREPPPSLDRLPLDLPEPDEHLRRAEELSRAFAAAPTEAARARTLAAWDLERTWAGSRRAIVAARHAKDCRRKELRTAQDAWDAAAPQLIAAEAEMARRLLAHPSRLELYALRGRRAFERAEAALAAHAPGAPHLHAEEAALLTKGRRLLAEATGPFGGDSLTLAGLHARTLGKERETRRAAHEVRLQTLAGIAPEVDATFARLVEVRRSLAAFASRGTPTLHSFARVPRADLEPHLTRALREKIGEEAARLRVDWLRVQGVKASRPSTDDLDERMHDEHPSPEPGLASTLVDAVRSFLRVAGPPPFDAFDTHVARGMLDVQDRPGKAPGAEAVDLLDPGLAAIIVHGAGSRDDVPQLLFALGDALRLALAPLPPGGHDDPHGRRAAIFGAGKDDPGEGVPADRSALEARQAEPASRAFVGTLFGLHALPSYELFFGKEAERARLARMADLLAEVAHLAALAAFEEECCAGGLASAGDRDRAYRRAEERFLPWRAYADLPLAQRGMNRIGEWLLFEETGAAQDRLLGTVAALEAWAAMGHLDRPQQSARVGRALYAASRMPFQELCRHAGGWGPIDAPLAGLGAAWAWLDARR